MAPWDKRRMPAPRAGWQGAGQAGRERAELPSHHQPQKVGWDTTWGAQPWTHCGELGNFLFPPTDGFPIFLGGGWEGESFKSIVGFSLCLAEAEPCQGLLRTHALEILLERVKKIIIRNAIFRSRRAALNHGRNARSRQGSQHVHIRTLTIFKAASSRFLNLQGRQNKLAGSEVSAVL